MPATRRPCPLVYSAACLLALLGCASSPRETPYAAVDEERVVALIDASPITADELRAILHEQAGSIALAELVLDRALSRTLAERGIELTRADIAREQELLLEGLDSIDQQLPKGRLVERLRARRGLGPQRYDSLLERNAALRAMVGDDSEPSTGEVQLARRVAFGPSATVRLFVSPDRDVVADLRQKLAQTEPRNRPSVLADAAARLSTHPSAERGGLIQRLSPADPQYPGGITQAVRSTPIGEISPILATDAGHALLYIESRTDATEPTPERLERLYDELTRRKQRIAMERLADQLLKNSDVIVMDRSLKWSWDNRP